MADYIERDLGLSDINFKIVEETRGTRHNTSKNIMPDGGEVRYSISGGKKFANISVKFSTLEDYQELRDYLDSATASKQHLVFLEAWGGTRSCYVEMTDEEWAIGTGLKLQNYKLNIREA